MSCQTKGLLLSWALFLSHAAAQTSVTTTGGTVNTVPLFTGTSAIGNSVITQSSGKVGIGTGAPLVNLDVSGIVHVSGLANPTTTSQGAYFGWNALTGGAGETDFINNQGGGAGGFAFMNTPASGSPRSTLLFITGGGSVGLGTASPIGLFDVKMGTNQHINFVGNVNGAYNGVPGILSINDANNAYTPMGFFASHYYFGGGFVGILTTSPGAPLEVNGNVKLSSGSGASIIFADGTVQNTAYTGVGGTCGGDYAESVDVSGNRRDYEAGDVLVISKREGSDVSRSSEPYSTLVIGVYSTKPALVGRRQLSNPKTSSTEVPMAMVGIVPTKVTAENGPIKRGDLLVTSSTAGYAMKGTDRTILTGAVIGKALGSLEYGEGVIEIFVTLQ